LVARRLENGAHLRPGGDSQLREDPIQVRPDGSMGKEEPLADLAVRQAGGHRLGDLELESAASEMSR
jgi:hypothetical protein